MNYEDDDDKDRTDEECNMCGRRLYKDDVVRGFCSEQCQQEFTILNNEKYDARY